MTRERFRVAARGIAVARSVAALHPDRLIEQRAVSYVRTESSEVDFAPVPISSGGQRTGTTPLESKWVESGWKVRRARSSGSSGLRTPNFRVRTDASDRTSPYRLRKETFQPEGALAMMHESTSIDYNPGGSFASVRANADATARRNGVAGVMTVVVIAVIWGTAETARALDFPERRTKAVIAAGVTVLACIQIALGLLFAAAGNERAVGTIVSLKRWHRTTGMVTLLGVGFVTYLCMTGPFAGGPTLHRVVGLVTGAVLVVKIPVVVNIPHRRALVVTLGLLLATGFGVAFLTKGLDVLW